MAGRRVNEVRDNVFAVSGRINSTWGGGLVDMVRCQRLLETIESENVINRAAEVGSWFLPRLETMLAPHAIIASNARGRGRTCAFDVVSTNIRTGVLTWRRAT